MKVVIGRLNLYTMVVIPIFMLFLNNSRVDKTQVDKLDKKAQEIREGKAKLRICHITTAHPCFDIRIFYKECKALADAGYEVYLVARHDKEEVVDGVHIIPLPKVKNRIERMFFLVNKAFEIALKLNADVYHFHDPEFIPKALKLKRLGKRVIYDAHEDVPRQIMSKPYLKGFSREIFSKVFEIYENYAARKFDVVITATPYIRDRFLKLNPNTVDVNNYPLLDEFTSVCDWDKRNNDICYIGGISKGRGIIELIKALEFVDTTLHLAGGFESRELEEEVKKLDGWKKVRYYGFVDRAKVRDILCSVKVGIITLHPEPNHIMALPNKMFEYMAAGLAIVASNFPLWEEIINKSGCGLSVNPLDPEAIAQKIRYLLENDELARKMGEHGRKWIFENYSWGKESEKLKEVYKNFNSFIEVLA
jgi:glycosyltransferase involved in cell wall biosynthesis